MRFRRCPGFHCWWGNGCRGRRRNRYRWRSYRFWWRLLLHLHFGRLGFRLGGHCGCRLLFGFLFNRSRWRRFDDFLDGFLLLDDRFLNGGRDDLVDFVDFGPESLAELIGKPVLDGVRVRRYRHTHVLQLTNDFGVVEVQLSSELIDSKFFCHESVILPLLFLGSAFFGGYSCRLRLGFLRRLVHTL